MPDAAFIFARALRRQIVAAPLMVSFRGGEAGPWRITHMAAVKGEGLARAHRLCITTGQAAAEAASTWTLRGVVSHPRYATTRELSEMAAIQEGLGRSVATCAALIPIRKSDAWWSMGQDQRRAIFEDGSRHIGRSMRFLPAIARRLHHARDLGEPFDFVTWFEYAPEHRDAFEELLAELRQTPEWTFVERETDVRLVRS